MKKLLTIAIAVMMLSGVFAYNIPTRAVKSKYNFIKYKELNFGTKKEPQWNIQYYCNMCGTNQQLRVIVRNSTEKYRQYECPYCHRTYYRCRDIHFKRNGYHWYTEKPQEQNLCTQMF